MLRTLHNLNVVPPGGFKFFCPHTGKWSESFTCVRDLMNHIRKFYEANNWDDAPAEEDVLDELCRLLELHGDDTFCEGSQPQPKDGKIKVSIKALAQGTKVYADWIKSSQKVSVVEAERRASICVQCPWNVTSNECKSCRGLSRFAVMVGDMAKFVGGLPETSLDKRLHTCLVCLCANKIKVFCPLDIILANITEDQKSKLWERCWIL